MDLFSAINDRTVLQTIARDVEADVKILLDAQPTTLFGTESAQKVDVSQLLSVLGYLQTQDAPMWQLQYMFYIVAFLSESLINALRQGTPQTLFKAWNDGCPHSLRERVSRHLLGKYCKKAKKGSRKTVKCNATPPHMAITSEFLLIYTLTTNS